MLRQDGTSYTRCFLVAGGRHKGRDASRLHQVEEVGDDDSSPEIESWQKVAGKMEQERLEQISVSKD